MRFFAVNEHCVSLSVQFRGGV